MTPVLGSKILALALGVVLLAGCAAREQTYTDPDTGLKVTTPAGFVMGKALPLNSGGTAEVSFASAEEPSITIEVARDWVKNSTGPAFADKTFAQRELPSNSAEVACPEASAMSRLRVPNSITSRNGVTPPL